MSSASLPSAPAPHNEGPGPRWLADDARFWAVCTALLGSFAILKGLRWPGEWALTQSQLDYSHGLVKRGLLGWVCGALHLHHRLPLSVAFFAELALFFWLLTVLTRRCGLAARFGTGAVTAAFASSYAVTYGTHLVGYTDIPNAILAMLLLAVRRPKSRFLLGLVLVPIAMLIHESFLLLFLPAILFSFYIDVIPGSEPRLRSKDLLYPAVLGGVALLFAFALSLRANLSEATLEIFQQEIAGRVDFPLRDDVFLTLHRSLLQNAEDVLVVMRQEQWWRNLLASVFSLLPLLLLTLRWISRFVSAVTQSYGERTQRSLWATAMLSTFAPLLIYALGWDCARWNVLCVLAAYLTLLLLSRRLPGVTVPFTEWDRHAVILVLAINMASGFGFFDNFEAHPYPFFPALMGNAH